MIFDGVDLSTHMHAECARPVMASPTVSTSTVAGRDGFEVSGVKLESIDVGVECYVLPGWPLPMKEGIRATSDLKRIIASELYRKEKKRLVFDDDPGLYCMAIATGVSDVERVGYVDYFTVTFTCDPIFHSFDETVQELAAGANVLTVGGTAPTAPLFEIKASSNRVTLTKGDGQQVTAECSNGSVVRFDMERRRATVNGSDTRVTLASRFFQLEPGESSVHVSGGSGSVRYREAWL